MLEQQLKEMVGPDTIAKRLGIDAYKVGKPYYREDNSRAETDRSSEYALKYNEYHELDDAERNRVFAHEMRHAITDQEIQQAVDEHENGLRPLLFVLSDEFSPLLQRMKKHFQLYKSQNYPFGKQKCEAAVNYNDLMDSSNNYGSPDEVLALLEGCRQFLDQQQFFPNQSTEPYEFIEAFTEDDLKFLDLDYRLQLTKSPEVERKLAQLRSEIKQESLSITLD